MVPFFSSLDGLSANSYQRSMKYFLYIRKSTDSEDKQILSLESQRRVLERFVQEQGLDIVELPPESQSAKTPGRPIFNDMLDRLEKGEAQGIVAWHPDRLARNSVDGGRILYLADREKIVDMRFPKYNFENSPEGKFMLGVVFSQTKYQVDSMSVTIRRGMDTKVELGSFPGRAPLGYLNDPRTRNIIADPDRFDDIGRLWSTYATGESSLDDLVDLAEDLGLRTRGTRRVPEGPVSRSVIHRILTNPFYTGRFQYKGEVYDGNHPRMIDDNTFTTVQTFLGGASHPKEHYFPFRSFLRCGACGRKITAERKIKPSGRRYVYYHCSSQRRNCDQPSVEKRDLERQIAEFLESLRLPDRALEQLFRHLEWIRQDENGQLQEVLEKLQVEEDRLAQTQSRLISMNLKQLLTDEEFLAEKSRLTARGKVLRTKLRRVETELTREWGDSVTEDLNFAQEALRVFEEKGPRERECLLQRICSNPVILDKKLLISAKSPFDLAPVIRKEPEAEKRLLEPCKCPEDSPKNGPKWDRDCKWYTQWDCVRTRMANFGQSGQLLCLSG